MRKAAIQSIRSLWLKDSKYKHRDIRIRLAPHVGFLQELVSDPGTQSGVKTAKYSSQDRMRRGSAEIKVGWGKVSIWRR